MNCNSNFGGKKALLMLGGLLCLLAASAGAQTSSGQLTITMNVQSSISLVFQNNPAVGTTGFCPLTNAGTNNVGLDLGTAHFPGICHTSACVNYTHLTGAVYEVSSAFDVVVTKANSSSPNYRMAAQISTPPPANVTWLINNVTLNDRGLYHAGYDGQLCNADYQDAASAGEEHGCRAGIAGDDYFFGHGELAGVDHVEANTNRSSERWR